MTSVLVVGAGISGCVAARLLAEKGYEVLVVDRRNHIGGNAYDARNAAGITIQMHGPHIFHDRTGKVWDFLSRFADWRPYQLRTKAYVEGRHVPDPINIDTINELFGYKHDADTIGRFFEQRRERITNPKTYRDAIAARVGGDLYELFFENYARKKWGLDGNRLPVFLAGRQSARLNRDDRYYTDGFQGVPEQGFTSLFTAMLDHPSIDVRLNRPYRDLPDDYKRLPTIYSGCVDEFFGYRFGKLPYRSIQFVFRTYDGEWHQPAAIVNYPNDYDFLRSAEFKRWTGERSSQTTVVYEYPCDNGDPYYPMPTLEARELHQKYIDAAKSLGEIHFVGPLGMYRNMDMNHAALAAMEVVEKRFPARDACDVIVAENVS